MNPFRYSEPLPVAEMIDRDAETRQLVETAVSGNGSRLVAPRRYGKTSLLNRLGEEIRREGWVAVYVNFFGVLSLADVAARIERAYSAQLEGSAASWFSGFRRRLRPTIRVGSESAGAVLEAALDPQSKPELLDRLAIPARLFERTGTRSLVIFDEFQDVLAAGDRTDAVVRSEIEHHGDAASYVFAGSQLGMMRRLFADKRRAMYGQARPVDLPPLPPDAVAEYLDERFRATGKELGSTLEPLLDLSAGHPQRTMLLANLLWELTPAGERATDETWAQTVDAAIASVRDELRAVWTSLGTGQRRVLTGIAENLEGVYAAANRHGGSRGGSNKTAIEVLADGGEIYRDETTRSGYRLVDPLLALWILTGREEP